ncbi:MAG: tRNA lysidine(34) synthetase TilS [Betaproteobacteria bacterium]|nr:MAG: tRNA lysidine(34) synthetase TilS [Betaproteobacteria bacterium]
MASSRKPRSAEVLAAVGRAMPGLEGKRIVVGLSGGVDSVVLLHALSRAVPGVRAAHINHGLSPNARRWAEFCRRLCRRLGVPLTVRRVRVAKRGEGLEAAARAARYAALGKLSFDVLALAHQLDDQAETVLLNLLRGAGPRGASGMRARATFRGRTLLRPLLEVPRESILAYAREHELAWIEDESNLSDAYARNFIRLHVAPLFSARYPRWREALARAARHFARTELDASIALREFLAAEGLRAPSEAKLVEMLRQLTAAAPGTRIAHDGAELRVYRGEVRVAPVRKPAAFEPVAWQGERKLTLAALGGELRFRRARGRGIDARWLQQGEMQVKLRAGGERLQPDARRPRRTLKNLFQEAGVPPWERERMPLLYRGDELVWAPGLGVDTRYRAARKRAGWVPEWRLTC